MLHIRPTRKWWNMTSMSGFLIGSRELWLTGDASRFTAGCHLDIHIWTHVPSPLIDPCPHYTVCRFCGKRKDWTLSDEELGIKIRGLIEQLRNQ